MIEEIIICANPKTCNKIKLEVSYCLGDSFVVVKGANMCLSEKDGNFSVAFQRDFFDIIKEKKDTE